MNPSSRENAEVYQAESSSPKISVEKHEEFIKSLSIPSRDFDDIDDAFDDLTVVDPYEVHAPSRRSDKEVSNLLALLDNLENNRKEIR